MTKEEAQNKVIALAKSRVGTHESGDNWTTFAQEADAKGWTMRAYGFTMQGRAWCDFHVDDCFWETFGFENGQKMLYQDGETGGAACNRSADFFRQHNAFVSKPQLAAQVIYSGEGHTGLVVALNANGSFDSVDGNYSDAVTLRQGLWPSCASGFGIPDWSVVADDESSADEPSTDEPSTDTQTFSANDIVSLKRGATYYNGGNIPAKYFLYKWVILQVNGDRAVLNTSSDGTITGWMSPVNTSNLTLVTSANNESVSANIAQTVTGDTAQTSVSSPAGTVYQNLVEKIRNNASETSPVILNDTSTSVHTYGGKTINVQERNK